MQKVEDIKINYKQCQDVLDCAEKRLQTNGLGVTTEGYNLFFINLKFHFSFSLDLVATAKNVYTGMITAGSKANQTHKIVEVRIFILKVFLYKSFILLFLVYSK
jgi:hypothetical protein